MENKNCILTFVAAGIPGIGYMYLGFIKRGVQALLAFLFIGQLFQFIGAESAKLVILLPFWCYTFFDTFRTAARLKRGEAVEDDDFFANDTWLGYKLKQVLAGRNGNVIMAWSLIIIGIMAIVNRILDDNELYFWIGNGLRHYFFPVLLIVGGLYLLSRRQRTVRKEHEANIEKLQDTNDA